MGDVNLARAPGLGLGGDGLGGLPGWSLGVHGLLRVSLVGEGQDIQLRQEHVWRVNRQGLGKEVGPEL